MTSLKFKNMRCHRPMPKPGFTQFTSTSFLQEAVGSHEKFIQNDNYEDILYLQY